MNAQLNRRKYIYPAIRIAILLLTAILIIVQIGRAQAAPRTPLRPTRPAAVATTGSSRPIYPTRRPTPQRGG